MHWIRTKSRYFWLVGVGPFSGEVDELTAAFPRVLQDTVDDIENTVSHLFTRRI